MNKEDKSKLELIGEIAQANNKNLALIEEINDLQQIIEKAIEYMDNTFNISSMKEFHEHLNNIENILKGSVSKRK